MPDVEPPPTKKMSGRPKKKRRLEACEVMKNKTQLGHGLKKKCGICHNLGHNRKSYTEKPSQQPPSEAGLSDPGPFQQTPCQAAPTQPPPPSPPTQPT